LRPNLAALKPNRGVLQCINFSNLASLTIDLQWAKTGLNVLDLAAGVLFVAKNGRPMLL